MTVPQSDVNSIPAAIFTLVTTLIALAIMGWIWLRTFGPSARDKAARTRR
ncbi:MAG TPA: hypothetical protein VG184_10865 [Acidimicrobiales bacterium]|nr:hypothetical protein [Acidimicrobiales bacterium]